MSHNILFKLKKLQSARCMGNMKPLITACFVARTQDFLKWRPCDHACSNLCEVCCVYLDSVKSSLALVIWYQMLQIS